ncbi:glycerate kinase [Bosea sp. SSUT16]|uniref:Glycerate kinase n=1 Tax=Bosea spartocytisi TaxID=2773451 RepID=A0A927E807_9HYPH|nr:glycerate kinase [Bosea spartocytisi]MBD3845994.1 glycerate kinase [Bosea spartocytisi]MCT4473178.1 glycerate kinase [Bosea spartocytisi]
MRPSSIDISELRLTARTIYDAAVARAHPSGCLPQHLPPAPERGRLILLAAGKAAGSMTALAEAHYLEGGLPPERLTGHAVARHGYTAPTRLIPMVAAGHPVPDEGSVASAGRALELAASATADDLVLVLLSGGGSANWVAPAGQLTLAEKRAVTKALLRSGAPIGEMNIVRKRLSRIKGGRLALAAAPARLLTLAISDVPGDDPAAIASGPTVPDPSTMADARAIVARYGLDLPPAARALIDDDANETPKPGHPAFANSTFRIIARPADALAAARAAAEAAGYEVIDLGADLEGEAREVAAAHADMARRLKAEGRRAAILSGGELTVTLRGSGRGGPSQEYALALAIALGGEAGIVALAGDTDGTDGGGGEATDPAGAVIDPQTLTRAAAIGLDPARSLADNDSTGFFEALGDLLQPGPTLTNVNDCRVILIEP